MVVAGSCTALGIPCISGPRILKHQMTHVFIFKPEMEVNCERIPEFIALIFQCFLNRYETVSSMDIIDVCKMPFSYYS